MPGPEPNEELAGLLKAIGGDGLSPEEHARLEAILREDPQARKHYLRYVHTEALLAWRYASVPNSPAQIEAGDETTENVVVHPDRFGKSTTRPGWRRVLGVAAVLLLGLFLGLPLGSLFKRSSAGGSPVFPRGEAVAVLASVGNDVRWNKAHSMPRVAGSELGKGWMQIDAGTIELKFRSGATVQVDGPAVFGIDSAKRGFLDYGHVSVHAPQEARDFVVGTASMEVVDLGTRFALSVDADSGKAKVKVLEGLVDLHLRKVDGQDHVQPLPAGQSANIDADGKILGTDGTALDPKYQPNTKLLAHWPLDRADATAKVADLSGNGLNGQLQGETDAIPFPGKAGEAFDLTRGGYIDISTCLPALTRTSAFTFTAWIADAKGMIFSMSDGTPRNRVQFEISRNRLLYGWQKGGQFDHVAAGLPEWEAGRWYHVAVSVSGGFVTLYRDGHPLLAPRSTGMQINTPSLGPMAVEKPTHAYIGYLIANHINQPQALGGKIGDVQIYGRALDERAIRYLYEHPGEAIQAVP